MSTPDPVPARVLMAHRSGPVGRLGRVRFVGRVEGGRGVPTGGMRRWDGWAISYVFAGHGRYRDAGHDLPLGPGDLVHIAPGHPHWFGVTGAAPWSEVFLAVDGPALDLAGAQGLLDVARPVRRLLPVEHWVERIDSFRVRRPPLTAAGADDEVCAVLRLLVEADARETPPAAPGVTGRRGWLAASQARLAAELGEPLDLREVAASVGWTYESWRKRFQLETGLAPGRWRQQRRVDAAGELLRWTSLTVRDVAASVGFTDGHHLSTVFRRATGLTTGEYRRTIG